jgi:hypothetical protein
MESATNYPQRRVRTDVAHPYYRDGQGYNAGLHPADVPSTSTNYGYDDDDSGTRFPNSVRRYKQGNNEVIEQGNKRLVIHNDPPPKSRIHWSVIYGVGMLSMLGLFVGISTVIAWWNMHQADALYGNPRTYQTDMVIGHGDSAAHKTHFIAVNLNRQIIIIEIQGGDPAHIVSYQGPQVASGDGSQLAVTLSFSDKNGDGKPDMIVHIDTAQVIYYNTGKGFKEGE